MKKILPSTLLLLGVSSTLLAQTYDRSTGGFWDDLDQWSPEKGRPRRVPNGERVQINLNNAGTNPLNLDLKGNSYVINELNVSGNAWRFSRGTLAFSTLEFVPAQIRYSGTQTLTLATALDLRAITELNVSDSAGTVRLAGMITGNGMLIKDGNGTLLIEAPFGTGSSQLYLRGGTTGIASTSLGSHDFSVVADSNLFAFNSDLYIAGTLKTFSPNIKLNVIDNPSDPTPHSVILKGDKFGDGTINQLSHGDLIFEGTDHFKGTLNTQAGYGRIILNSNTTANVQMKGGQIAGIGGTRGDLTARNGAIISPGYNGSSGTLSFRDAYFDPSTILNFKFGQSNVIGNFQNDLVQIDKNLTLAGKLGIHAALGLGDGASTDRSTRWYH